MDGTYLQQQPKITLSRNKNSPRKPEMRGRGGLYADPMPGYWDLLYDGKLEYSFSQSEEPLESLIWVPACEKCILFRLDRRTGTEDPCHCVRSNISCFLISQLIRPSLKLVSRTGALQGGMKIYYSNKDKINSIKFYQKAVANQIITDQEFFIGCFVSREGERIKEQKDPRGDGEFVYVLVEIRGIKAGGRKGGHEGWVKAVEVKLRELGEGEGGTLGDRERTIGCVDFGITVEFKVYFPNSSVVRFGVHVELPVKRDIFMERLSRELSKSSGLQPWKKTISNKFSDSSYRHVGLTQPSPPTSREFGPQTSNQNNPPSPGEVGFQPIQPPPPVVTPTQPTPPPVITPVSITRGSSEDLSGLSDRLTLASRKSSGTGSNRG